MISRLTGSIVHVDPKYIVVDVQGVGYKVATTVDIMTKLNKEQGPVTLWTYLAVRETALDLYGFLSLSELSFFELLITISGIGPKTALGILNSASVEALETAVQTGDTSHIVKVSGIGKKVAEKIVLELKDKVEKVTHTPEAKTAMRGEADALEALKSLGYTQNEARDALKELPKTITKTNEKIKEALKILGK
ncbi:MAG: holliday junction helicase RuvA [Patescibacteria group bacterium]|nr:holliday junction helicase RuvA [Patescibacteria group bacterium]